MSKRIVLSCLLAICSIVSFADENTSTVKTNRVEFTETAQTISNSACIISYDYYAKRIISIDYVLENRSKSNISIDNSKSDNMRINLLLMIDSSSGLKLNIGLIQPIEDQNVLNKEYINIGKVTDIDVYICNQQPIASGKLAFNDILNSFQHIVNDVNAYVNIAYPVYDRILVRTNDKIINIDIQNLNAYMVQNINMLNDKIRLTDRKVTDESKNTNINDKSALIQSVLKQYSAFDQKTIDKVIDKTIRLNRLTESSDNTKYDDAFMKILTAMSSITSNGNAWVLNYTISTVNSISDIQNQAKIDINAYKQLCNAVAYESCNNLADSIAENRSASDEIKIKAKRLQFTIYSLKELNYRVKNQKPDKSMFDFGSIYWQLYKEYEEATNDLDREIIIDWIQAQLESEFKSRSRKLKIIEK